MPDKDNSFKTYVLDQLDFLEGLACRPMFCGYGLYDRQVFFGIVHGGRLFFKTDVQSQADYVALGMAVFRPNEKQRLKNYYEVPAEILEDQEHLTHWVRRAIACGRSS